MPRALQLSATTLSLFQECPRCFWLHMRAGLKRPARPFPSITGGIDRVVQGECDRLRPAMPATLYVALMEVASMEVASQFSPCLMSPKVAYLRCTPGDIALVGRLDDCLQYGAMVAPLDHKSRGSRPDPGYSAQYYQLQMDVYALLLQRNGYPVSEEAYLAYYYPLLTPGALDAGGAMPFGCMVEVLPVSCVRAEACYQAACTCLADDCPVVSAPDCAYCAWAMEITTYSLASRLPA